MQRRDLGKQEAMSARKPYDPSPFPTFAVTVDVALFVVRDAQLHILLVRRNAYPFEGMWALPGGFKRPDETLDEAAARELAEETGLRTDQLRQVHAYGDPGRDPRPGIHVVTVCYFAAIAEPGEIRGGTDAAEARFWPVSELESGHLDLAFDHSEIVRDVLKLVRARIEESPLATDFLPLTFSISELRAVYDAVLNRSHEPSNFHRRFLAEHGRWLTETGERRVPRTGRGRPAALYRRSERWTTGAPGAASR